ncbi:MAG: hypothetical protein HFI39_01130 [Lachnospiraceae bacterium]|nr:hypothetical protein [Lachnospiraceae bacterium]
MPNTKTGTTWAPDIRLGSIETFTENFTPEGGETQTATYKIVPSHPILSKVLDKTAWFRTHAGAVWYNRLEGTTVLQMINNLIRKVNELSRKVTTSNIKTIEVKQTEDGTNRSVVNFIANDETNNQIVFESDYIRFKKVGDGTTTETYFRPLGYEAVNVGTATIASNGYYRGPNVTEALFATVDTWTTNTGAFSVAIVSNILYVIGAPNTVVNGLRVRIWKYK